MNKNALVTGANKGLGLETCRQLAAKGFKVFLTARNQKQGKEAAEALKKQGLEVQFLELDIASDESIEQAVDYLRSHGQRIDLLVNNAGVLLDAPINSGGDNASILQTDRQRLREAMEINVFGPIMLIKALLPLFNDAARIINISSGMGQLSEMGGYFPSYRISKTALNAVTRIYAEELKSRNISINSVCPGWVRTDMGGADANCSVSQGVETTLWLATTEQVPNGGFFRDMEPIQW